MSTGKRTQLLDILGEVQQVGRVEVRGRYFADPLLRVLPQIRPSTMSDLLACVVQATEAKNSLIRRCGCSPFRSAIGRVFLVICFNISQT